jgi:hypothetical protein
MSSSTSSALGLSSKAATITPVWSFSSLRSAAKLMPECRMQYLSVSSFSFAIDDQ